MGKYIAHGHAAKIGRLTSADLFFAAVPIRTYASTNAHDHTIAYGRACMYVCMYVCIHVLKGSAAGCPPLLGLVFFGVAFGGCLRSLSGLPVLGRVLGCTQAMADGKPKGLNKMFQRPPNIQAGFTPTADLL